MARVSLGWILLSAFALAGAFAATTGPFSSDVEDLCDISSMAIDESRISFLGELRYANLSAADIAYYRFGNAASGRPAVVLVSGFGGTSVSWPLAFLEDLAAEQEVVVFDNRAVGHSTGSITNVTIVNMAGDVAELAQALELYKPNLFGWSMGGMIALNAAVLYEAVWNRVVVISGSPGGPSSAAPPFSTILSSYANGTEGLVTFQQLFPIVTESAIVTGCEYYNSSVANLNPVTVSQLVMQAKAIYQYFQDANATAATTAAMQGLGLDVMAIAGALDTAVPPSSLRSMALYVTSIELLVYPYGGHGAWIQYYDDFWPALDAFLGRAPFGDDLL